jgi:hypothetical protein
VASVQWISSRARLSRHNSRLAQRDRTVALFDWLPPGDTHTGSLAMVARDVVDPQLSGLHPNHFIK